MSANQSFDTFQSSIKSKRAFPGPWLFREHLDRSLGTTMRRSGNHTRGAAIRESHPQRRDKQDHQRGEKRRSGPFPRSKETLPMLPHAIASHPQLSPPTAPALPRCSRGGGCGTSRPRGSRPRPRPPPGPARRRPGRLQPHPRPHRGGRRRFTPHRGPRRSPTPTSGTSLPPPPGLGAAAAPGRA